MAMNENLAGLARTAAEVDGEEGVRWFQRLPEQIARYERRWRITVLPPFGNLTYNYVAPAVRRDGTPAVFKAGVVGPEARAGMAMLRACDGHGMARLLEEDREEGVILLERLTPGTPLACLLPDDDDATIIAASVMRELWRPPPDDPVFPQAATWAAGLQRLRARFAGGTGPLPEALVARAEAVFSELLASAPPSVLLHGDLHHGNILAAQHAPWLAIDPKGLIGDPAYDVGALLHNPMPWLLQQPDTGRLFARRLDLLTEHLGIERARLAGWGFALAVLSAWWSVEDHGYGWEGAITCAERLATQLT